MLAVSLGELAVTHLSTTHTGLANSEHCHPAGLLLKTNVLLRHEQEGSLERLQVTPSMATSVLFSWYQCAGDIPGDTETHGPNCGYGPSDCQAMC